jgi:hypothetical protein
MSGRRLHGRIVRRFAVGLTTAVILPCAVVFFYSLPAWLRLSEAEYAPQSYPSTIDEAVEACRKSGLSGWELAAFAQRITAERFSYSRRNPWDSPARAFERGLGYCLQQARALKTIYDRLEIENRIVMGSCSFPAKTVHGIAEPPGYGRHSWLRVNIDGVEKDVCPGDRGNYPGRVHFKLLSDVRTMPWWMIPFAHLGSVVVNSARDHAVRKTAGKF